MSAHIDVVTKLNVDGQPYSLFFLTNPTIEDILALEMRFYASEVQRGSIDSERRIDRGIRDFLIKFGVVP